MAFTGAMDLSGGTPMMTGDWYNPSTGDKFTVRDSYFENDQFFVVTTDGRRLDYNILQHYVQGKGPEPVPQLKDIPVPTAPVQLGNINQSGESIDTYILPEDNILTRPMAAKTAPASDTIQQPAVSNPNDIIIEKALSKCEAPTLKCEMVWEHGAPIREFETLRDMMDIPVEDIAEYICRKFVTLEGVKEAIREQLRYYAATREVHEEPKAAEVDNVVAQEKPKSKRANTKSKK